MRYISPYPRLMLMRKDGTVAHIFRNGVLYRGDAKTTNGTNTSSGTKPYTVDYYANSGDPDNEVMQVYETTLDGGTDHREELIGEGSLTGYDVAGDALTTLEEGYRGMFFKAPIVTLASGESGTVTDVANVPYEVLLGYIYYSGVKYDKNDEFVTDGTTVATSGIGEYSLTLPKAIVSTCNKYLKEHFKIKNLMDSDDAASEYSYDNLYGVDSYSSLTTLADNFYGKVDITNND